MSEEWSVERLLSRAAFSYRTAGLVHDACRVYVQLGQHLLAGQTYEEFGHYQDAALAFEKAKAFDQAARNYEQVGAWTSAASAWEKAAGQARTQDLALRFYFNAIWILLQELRAYHQARHLIENIELVSERDKLEAEVIHAYIMAGLGDRTMAGRRLHEILLQINTIQEFPNHLLQPTQIICEMIQRPDLIQRLYAVASVYHPQENIRKWRDWAKQQLGTTRHIGGNIKPDKPIGEEDDDTT